MSKNSSFVSSTLYNVPIIAQSIFFDLEWWVQESHKFKTSLFKIVNVRPAEAKQIIDEKSKIIK